MNFIDPAGLVGDSDSMQLASLNYAIEKMNANTSNQGQKSFTLQIANSSQHLGPYQHGKVQYLSIENHPVKVKQWERTIIHAKQNCLSISVECCARHVSFSRSFMNSLSTFSNYFDAGSPSPYRLITYFSLLFCKISTRSRIAPPPSFKSVWRRIHTRNSSKLIMNC